MTARIYFAALIVLGIFVSAQSLKGRGMPSQLAPLELNLESLPRTLELWKGEDIRLDPQVFRAIGAEMAVNRRYVNRDAVVELHSDVFTNAFIQGGVRILHPPELCYAGSGFIAEDSKTIQIPSRDGVSQPARLLTLSHEGTRVFCLYWYQVGDTTFWNSDDQRRVVWSFRGKAAWPPMIKVMLQTSADSPAAAKQKLESLAGPVYAWTRNYH